MPQHRIECLAVTGADRDSFLQGQLTQDVRRLGGERCLPAAWCSPKGRVIAFLFLVADADRTLLFLPGWQAAEFRERLLRYRLRAAVELEPEPGMAVRAWQGPLPQGVDALATLALPATESAASLVFGSESSLASAAIDWLAPDASELAEIRAGLPAITPPTAEQFTPHMLNLDLLDAVSFSKGCYTGQEVVARTEHLGRPPRRMLAFALDAVEPPASGEHVVDASGSAVGTIVRAARSETAVEALAVTSLKALPGQLRLASGAPIARRPLPYSVPELEAGV